MRLTIAFLRLLQNLLEFAYSGTTKLEDAALIPAVALADKVGLNAFVDNSVPHIIDKYVFFLFKLNCQVTVGWSKYDIVKDTTNLVQVLETPYVKKQAIKIISSTHHGGRSILLMYPDCFLWKINF